MTDQLSGRTMGLRADITPQAARIDAHRLREDGITRLCYVGDVLHTKPATITSQRNPIQVGAELYGHGGIESDAEVVSLMLDVLAVAGVNDAILGLGHVGIYRSLATAAALSEEQECELFDALQRKAVTEINAFVVEHVTDKSLASMLKQLPGLCGGASVLTQAKAVFADAPEAVKAALAELENTANVITQRCKVEPTFDLAELRGYHYHTGVVFSAYIQGESKAVAQGGRYDSIGEAFGRARPATGFSADLITLANCSDESYSVPAGIAAPVVQDEQLWSLISQLRAQGERVIESLSDQADDSALSGCNRKIVNQQGQWQVVKL